MTSIRKTSEYLTKAEQKKLSALILGYGKLTYAADKSQVSDMTLRNVALRGYGHFEIIKKIRETLLEPNTKLTPVNTTEN